MITKEMMIGEIAKKYPKTVKVLFDKGLHCIGCHVAGQESLEEGCKAHGLDNDTIEEMVKEMNEIIEKEK